MAAAVGGGQLTTGVTAAVLMVLVGLGNTYGVKVSGRFQLGLAGLLVALLVAAVAASLPHADLARLHPFAPHGWGAVGSAAALLVWSFAGWEAITHLAGSSARRAATCPGPPRSRWCSSARCTWRWRSR